MSVIIPMEIDSCLKCPYLNLSFDSSSYYGHCKKTNEAINIDELRSKEMGQKIYEGCPYNNNIYVAITEEPYSNGEKVMEKAFFTREELNKYIEKFNRKNEYGYIDYEEVDL